MENKTTSRIGISLIIVSFLGFFIELSNLIHIVPAGISHFFKNYLSYLTPFLPFKLAISDLLLTNSHITDNYFNNLSFAFYTIFLIASILFYKSKGKETRVLKFIVSIILINYVLNILSFLIGTLIFLSFNIKSLIGVFISCTWIFLSFILLKYLNRNTDLSHVKTEELKETPKGQRFFHLITDSIFMICLTFPILVGLLGGFMHKYNINMGNDRFTEQFILFLIMVLSRVIYYTFFEVLFKASPGKFLTNSIVVTDKKEKLDFTSGILRSLYRSVPFESLSFLGNEDGWHDKWSETKVLKTRTDQTLKKPLIIILGAGLILGLAHLVYQKQLDIKSKEYREAKFNYELQNTNFIINNLNADCIIALEEAREFSYGNDIYLKVEEIKGDNITFTSFSCKDYSPTVKDLVDCSNDLENVSIDFIEINKETLKSSYAHSFEEYNNGKFKGQNLLNEEVNYRIKKVYDINAPNIKNDGGSGRSSDEGYFNFENYGAAAKLISITPKEGGLTFTNELPQEIEEAVDFRKRFSINFKNFVHNKPYKFTFTIVDRKNRTYKYQVEGVNFDRTLKRVLD